MPHECALCAQPARQRCARCAHTYYCSRSHQKEHWKDHRDHCRPFKVARDSVLGRHLVATRDLLEGEVVLKEGALVAGPAQGTPPVCLGCLRLLTPEHRVDCERCGWPMCSTACALSTAHIPECTAAAQWRKQKVVITQLGIPNPMYRCVTVLRCLYLRDSNPGLYAKLLALEAHTAFCADRETAHLVRNYFRCTHYTEEEIMRVCGVLQVNGHEVPLTDPPHVAVYEEASMLEHDCRPTCAKSFGGGGVLRVRTAGAVGHGQHLSISYTDPLWGTAARRHHLRTTKFFWCRCARCADPSEMGTAFSGVRCALSSCTGFSLPQRPVANPPATDEDEEDLERMRWTCTHCAHRTPAAHVYDILDRVGTRLSALDKGDLLQCETFLEEVGAAGLLHPNHAYLTEVRLALAQLYGCVQGGGLATATASQLRAKLRLCAQLLDLVMVLVPAEHRVRGLLLFELQAAMAEEARRGERDGERDRLMERRRLLREAVHLLKYEPATSPEGQLLVQAGRDLHHVDNLLQGHVA